MNQSSYSGIDQEPNGRPVGPAGTPGSETSFAKPTGSRRKATSAKASPKVSPQPNDQTASSRADELAQARMDAEGGAQTHRRSGQSAAPAGSRGRR